MTIVDEAIIRSINAFAVFQHQKVEILSLNKIAASLLGWDDPADLVGKNFFDFLDQKSQQQVKTSIVNGSNELLYVQGCRKDGSHISLIAIPDTTSGPEMARLGIFMEVCSPAFNRSVKGRPGDQRK